MPQPFIIDGHLDLAFSALNFNRNLRLSIEDVRAKEASNPTPNGTITVTIPDLIKGKIGLVFGTLFVLPQSLSKAYSGPNIMYDDRAPLSERQNQAHKAAMRQLDYYHRLEEEDERVVIIRSWRDIETLIADHDQTEPTKNKVGILIHMEGADPIRDPSELDMWVERGLRSIGPAWADTRYAPGQWAEAGHLPKDGYRLLERMTEHNLLVDLTHISERASFDVLDSYEGPIAATHCNARALVPMARQLTDEQIRAVAERDGVIGIVLLNFFLRADHAHRGDSKELVTLDHVLNHIDHMCQLIGTADHVAVGSDFDGGFGAEEIPNEFDSVADLYKIADGLKLRGYTENHINNIMGGNWLRLIKQILA